MVKPTLITCRGITLSFSQWATRVNATRPKCEHISHKTISGRMAKGWDAEAAIFTPKIDFAVAGKKGGDISGWRKFRITPKRGTGTNTEVK